MRMLLFATGLLLGLALTTSASAGVVVETTGNIGTGFRIGGSSSQVEYSAWNQTSTYSDVTITATVGSLSGSGEHFQAYLTTAIGPSANFGDVVAFEELVAPAIPVVGLFSPVTLFTGLTLGPGTYYLVLFNTDPSPESNIRWARGNSTTKGSGVSGPFEGFANDDGSGFVYFITPFASTFVPSGLTDNAFSVTGTEDVSESAAAPEPATLGSALVALFGVGLLRRLRRSA